MDVLRDVAQLLGHDKGALMANLTLRSMRSEHCAIA